MADDLPARGERDAVRMALSLAQSDDTDADRLLDALLCWAGGLEARGLLDESCDVLELACHLRPSCAQVALHAARIARKAGRAEHARAMYDRVADLHPAAPLGLMAAIGHALLSDAPDVELSSVLRSAVAAGDHEAAAVAQQERARARRAEGDIAGAVRDYLVAGTRFRDPVDRGLVGHEVADMLVMRGDLEGAREALLEITRHGHPEQVAHARTRLRAIARAQGDQLGLRRYADAAAPPLVSLSPPVQRRKHETFAPALRAGMARVRNATARAAQAD